MSLRVYVYVQESLCVCGVSVYVRLHGCVRVSVYLLVSTLVGRPLRRRALSALPRPPLLSLLRLHPEPEPDGLDDLRRIPHLDQRPQHGGPVRVRPGLVCLDVAGERRAGAAASNDVRAVRVGVMEEDGQREHLEADEHGRDADTEVSIRQRRGRAQSADVANDPEDDLEGKRVSGGFCFVAAGLRRGGVGSDSRFR